MYTNIMLCYSCTVNIHIQIDEVLTKWDRLKALPEFQEDAAALASLSAGDLIYSIISLTVISSRGM